MPVSRQRIAALASSFALALTALVAFAASPASACVGCPFSPFVAPEYAGSGVQVNGAFQPLVGNFAGDTRTDVLWYAPGTAADSLWIGTATRGVFTKQTVRIDGTFTPIVGNFAGDSYDDILWYRPGTATDVLWVSVETGGPFQSVPITINGTFTPVVLHRWATTPHAVSHPTSRKAKITSPTLASIVWLAPGSAADAVWVFNGTAFGARTSVSTNIPGSPTALVPFNRGDDLNEDLLVYTAGSGYDAIWSYDGAGHFAATTKAANGTYIPFAVGDPAAQSILWLGPGSAPDAYWANSGATLTTRPTAAIAARGPLVRTFADSAYIYDPLGPEVNWSAGVVTDSTNTDVAIGYRLLAGDFDGDGAPDAFWYKAGSATERVFYGIPTAPA